MRSDFSLPRSRGLFVGLAILAIGVILLLDQEGILSAERVFRYFWPAIFIVFGLENVISAPAGAGRRVWGWIMFIFGVLLLGSHLGIRFLRAEDFWPFLIVLVGIALVARSLGFVNMGQDFWSKFKFNRIHKAIDGSSDDSQFDYVAIFGGVNQRIYSKNFRGGTLMALCGGWDLDLRRAEIEGDTAVIDANALMGGGQIRVPDTWIVDIRGTAIMGGYTDETAQQAPVPGVSQKRIIVKGAVIFGGVVVKN